MEGKKKIRGVERIWEKREKMKVESYVTNELGFYLMKWELS